MAVMQQLPDLSCLIQQLNPAHLFCSSTNLSLAVFFFFLLFDKTAALLRAYKFVALFQKNGATDRALFIGRPLPYHEIALRVADTAIVFSALLCLFRTISLPHLGHATPIFRNKVWYCGIPESPDMPGICREVRI